jgi:hypothetical protein
VEDPSLLPVALEELLRAYSPVTMARVVTEEVEVTGTLRPGDRVLMNFPAANRDPGVFADTDKVVIDRQNNRHIAFGVGIHRCAGSNLARLEMNVAVGAFISRIPEFDLENPDAVTWEAVRFAAPVAFPWCSAESPGPRTPGAWPRETGIGICRSSHAGVLSGTRGATGDVVTGDVVTVDESGPSTMIT